MGLGKNLKTAVGSWLLGTEIKGLTISQTETGMTIKNNNLTTTDSNQYLHVLNIASLEDAPRKIYISSPYMQNSTVAACVRVQATNIAQVPFVIYGPNDKPVSVSLFPGRLFDWVAPGMDRFMLWEATQTWRVIRGECFWEIIRGLDGRPVRISILNPDSITEIVDHARGVVMQWRLTLPNGSYRFIDAADMVHHHNYNPYNQYRGMSPLISGMLDMNADLAAQVFNYSFLNNDATPPVYITSDQFLTKEDADNIGDRFAQRHAGIRNKRFPAVLGKGASIGTFGYPMKDMLFIEQRKWTQAEICSLTGTPLAMIANDEQANIKSNVGERRAQLYDNTLIPDMRHYEATVDDFLEREKLKGYWCEFDQSVVDALKKNLSGACDNAVKLWALGVPYNVLDEKYGLGTGPIEGGDRGYINMGVMPADGSGQPQADTDGGADAATVVTEEAGALALNGAQITAAIEVLLSVRANQIDGYSAIQLLTSIGIPQNIATTMISRIGKLPKPPAAAAPKPAAAPVEKWLLWVDGKSMLVEQKQINILSTPGIKRVRAAAAKLVPGLKNALSEQFFYPMRQDLLAALETYGTGKKSTQDWDPTELIRVLTPDKDKYNALAIEVTTPSVTSAYALGAKSISQSLGMRFDLTNPAAQAALAKKRVEVVALNETIRRQLEGKIKPIIEESLANGTQFSVMKSNLYDAIKGTMNNARSRVTTIAQNEIADTVATARKDAMGALGVTHVAWVSSSGTKEPRDTHHGGFINGKVVEYGQKFPNGLRWPHDDEAELEDIINCECDIVPAGKPNA